MPQYIAFLRAINVAGRYLKMTALADHFKSLGMTEVRTYINSGNVLFQSKARQADALQTQLETGLAPLLGFQAEVFVRTRAQVQAIALQVQAIALQAQSQSQADSHPTAKATDAKAGALAQAKPEVNIAFLSAPLTAAQQADLQAFQSDVDSFGYDAPGGREVVWLCKVKQSESKFSNAVLERKLKIRTTFRRASMLQGLSALFDGTTQA